MRDVKETERERSEREREAYIAYLRGGEDATGGIGRYTSSSQSHHCIPARACAHFRRNHPTTTHPCKHAQISAKTLAFTPMERGQPAMLAMCDWLMHSLDTASHLLPSLTLTGDLPKAPSTMTS